MREGKANASAYARNRTQLGLMILLLTPRQPQHALTIICGEPRCAQRGEGPPPLTGQHGQAEEAAAPRLTQASRDYIPVLSAKVLLTWLTRDNASERVGCERMYGECCQ